jgi:peptidyl-prolyl cis-trans isomerase C
MSATSNFHKQKGNVKIIALVGVLLVAVAAGLFFITQSKVSDPASEAATAPAAGTETADSGPTSSAPAGAAPEITAGNPVVAKVDGKDITRMEVLNFIQTLPPQTREMPIEKLFPLAVDQVVNSQIVVEKTKGVQLDNDPEVQKQMERAKDEITRTVYLQKQVEERITEDRLKAAYDNYVKNFPNVQEVKASHILVKEEAKAKDLIAQLEKGGDFATLAKENSTDGTAKSGGELGYFVESEVVPDFAKAAFALTPGTYTKEPVKTNFGFHIIKSEEKRKREPAAMEQVKPFLQAQLRREILEGMLKEWRDQAKVETFDINGNKIEPASGQ